METIPTDLSVDGFLAWAEGRSGRHELFGGRVLITPGRSARNCRTRVGLYDALRDTSRKPLPTVRMLPAGIALRVGDDTCLVPDGSLYNGERLHDDAMELRDPIVLFEVLDSAPVFIDSARRLAEYARLPSVRHVVVLDGQDRSVIHHRRKSVDSFETHILKAGTLKLDPPGLSLDVADLFSDG